MTIRRAAPRKLKRIEDALDALAVTLRDQNASSVVAAAVAILEHYRSTQTLQVAIEIDPETFKPGGTA